MIFWWNKKFSKAYYLLLLFPKKIELYFGWGPCWPSFCPNRVLEEQFLTTLLVFFQEYDNTSYKYQFNVPTYLTRNQQKNPWCMELKGKIWPNSTINKGPLTWPASSRENWMMNIKNFHGAIQSNNAFFCRLQAHEILTGVFN